MQCIHSKRRPHTTAQHHFHSQVIKLAVVELALQRIMKEGKGACSLIGLCAPLPAVHPRRFPSVSHLTIWAVTASPVLCSPTTTQWPRASARLATSTSVGTLAAISCDGRREEAG